MSYIMSSEEVINTLTGEIERKSEESRELFSNIQYDNRSNVYVKDFSIEIGATLMQISEKGLVMIEKENKKIIEIAKSFQEIDDDNRRGIENGK